MVGKMLENYTSDALKDISHNGQGYLQEALGRLVEYKAQTTEMLERVGATRGDVSSVLPIFPSMKSNPVRPWPVHHSHRPV